MLSSFMKPENNVYQLLEGIFLDIDHWFFFCCMQCRGICFFHPIPTGGEIFKYEMWEKFFQVSQNNKVISNRKIRINLPETKLSIFRFSLRKYSWNMQKINKRGNYFLSAQGGIYSPLVYRIPLTWASIKFLSESFQEPS